MFWKKKNFTEYIKYVLKRIFWNNFFFAFSLFFSLCSFSYSSSSSTALMMMSELTVAVMVWYMVKGVWVYPSYCGTQLVIVWVWKEKTLSLLKCFKKIIRLFLLTPQWLINLTKKFREIPSRRWKLILKCIGFGWSFEKGVYVWLLTRKRALIRYETKFWHNGQTESGLLKYGHKNVHKSRQKW